VSTEDLWKVVGRARFDLAFGGKLKQDFAGTVHEAGYELSSTELADANAAVDRLLLDPSTLPAQMAPDPAAQAKMMKHWNEQRQRFTDFMYQTIKNTFRYASLTYKSITWMNWLTFGTGIALFAFTAIYALFAEQKAYSVLFAGLGVSSFVTSFVLSPPGKTQKALSDLVQTEVAFMNFFDQLSFGETYANTIDANPLSGKPPSYNLANIEKASFELMERARETVELLQHVDGRGAEGEHITDQHSRRAPEESGTPAPTTSSPTPPKPS